MPPLPRVRIGWLEDVLHPLPSRVAEGFLDFPGQAARPLDWLRDRLSEEWSAYQRRPWWSVMTGPEGALVVGWQRGQELSRLGETPPPDEELKRRARRGDPAALEELARLLARQYGLPESVFLSLLYVESGLRHYDEKGRVITSSAGALGIGQLMPATAKALGVDPRDPVANLEGAARYLRQQLDRFGDIERAVAAYNAGPGTVAVVSERYGDRWRDYLPDETKDYLVKVLGGAPASGQARSGGDVDLTSVDEATIALLKRYGFTDEDIRAYLRRQYLGQGLSTTSPLDVLGTGIGWLRGLASDYQQALESRFGAESEATKLLVSLLGRAAPEGGIPLEGANYFSRLAGLPPLQQPETRRVDLSPLFDLARRMEPTENAYFGALAKAAERLGTDLPGLWQKALEEAGAYDQATGQGVSAVLEDWRSRLAQQAATPEQVAAALGYAM